MLQSASDLAEEFSHIAIWAEANQLIIYNSKTHKKDIGFRNPCFRGYVPNKL